MYYSLIRKLLFRFDPEKTHYFALNCLRLLQSLGLIKNKNTRDSGYSCMGITFPNRIGLSAGFDKNGDYLDALATLGFGFIEVGTVTLLPQEGNPLPRLFRLPSEKALINRMGFNNKGIDYLITRLQKTHYKGVLGINIGKNKTTPLEEADKEYLTLLRRVLPYASYVTINISSPNTPDLRQLQQHDLLARLLSTLKTEQALYAHLQKKYVPLIIKVAPDLTQDEIASMADIFLQEKIDGVLIGNTTVQRDTIANHPLANESGGLSGKPLTLLTTHVIRSFHSLLGEAIPIIGCGGIFSAHDASEKYKAGAKLLQIYTGLVYEGPALIQDLLLLDMPT